MGAVQRGGLGRFALARNKAGSRAPKGPSSWYDGPWGILSLVFRREGIEIRSRESKNEGMRSESFLGRMEAAEQKARNGALLNMKQGRHVQQGS
jgi:hypothetical protein